MKIFDHYEQLRIFDNGQVYWLETKTLDLPPETGVLFAEDNMVVFYNKHLKEFYVCEGYASNLRIAFKSKVRQTDIEYFLQVAPRTLLVNNSAEMEFNFDHIAIGPKANIYDWNNQLSDLVGGRIQFGDGLIIDLMDFYNRDVQLKVGSSDDDVDHIRKDSIQWNGTHLLFDCLDKGLCVCNSQSKIFTWLPDYRLPRLTKSGIRYVDSGAIYIWSLK